MDLKSLEVTPNQIAEYFARLFETLSGASAHFVFNADEMGHQDWADAREKICIIPVEHQGELYDPVRRTGKRFTLLAYISAEGGYGKPCVVIPRKTDDQEIETMGLTSETVVIYHQGHGYVDRAIFEDWTASVFIPELDHRRQLHGYGGPAFLIMDNCPSHSGERFEQLCREKRITPIWLPAHASDQLQMLDLSLFGLTKSLTSRINEFAAVNVQRWDICRVVCSFLSAATPLNIVQSLRNGGISLIRDDSGMLCGVTPHTARCLMLGDEALLPASIPEMTGDEVEGDDQEIA
jgi:hypothetical protein